MRLAALGLHHESNTYAPRPTTLADFRIDRHHDLAERHRGGRTTLTGYLDAAAGPGVDVVPLVFAQATPSGPIAAEAFEAIAGELVAALTAGGPWDGVLLALHGAAVADGFDDADCAVLARVRSVVGDDVPVGVALDLHANVSQTMARSSTAMACYRTNPHIDARERAADVASVIVRAARGEVRPVQALTPVPAVIDILRQRTGEEPMRSLVAAADRIERAGGVLLASVVEGYPYADVADRGMAALVVTDGDPGAARRHAEDLAAVVWSRRHDFTGRAVAVADAIEQAARSAGVGNAVSVAIGGRTDPAVGPPLPIGGTVVAVHDGSFDDPDAAHGGWQHFDMGPAAAVALTDGSGTVVVVSSRAVPAVSPVQLTCLGLDVGGFDAVVAKGAHSPLAGYGTLVGDVILVDTPGCTPAVLR